MANVSFTGNLGGDAELKALDKGGFVLNFSVADVPRRKNPNTGEWEDDESKKTWWRVAVWGWAAENLAGHLTKGTKVVVDGTVHSRSDVFCCPYRHFFVVALND